MTTHFTAPEGCGPVEAAPVDRRDEMLILYGLGVPVEVLAHEYGMRPASIRRLASRSNVRRPDYSDAMHLTRVARAERMRRHIEDYPNVSLFDSRSEAAA